MESSQNNILIASDGDTTMVLLNGIPVSAESMEFKANGLTGSTVSFTKMSLLSAYQREDFWKYMRDNFGCSFAAER